MTDRERRERGGPRIGNLGAIGHLEEICFGERVEQKWRPWSEVL